MSRGGRDRSLLPTWLFGVDLMRSSLDSGFDCFDVGRLDCFGTAARRIGLIRISSLSTFSAFCVSGRLPSEPPSLSTLVLRERLRSWSVFSDLKTGTQAFRFGGNPLLHDELPGVPCL